MSITATPDPETGAVKLVIDRSAAVDVMRSDANGVRPVRMTAAQRTIVGAFTVFDYEAAASGWVQYTYVNGSWTTGTSLDSLALLPRFSLPSLPHVSVTASTVHSYSAARKSRATFHQVINGPAQAVTTGALGLRAGTMAVLFPDYLAARDLESILSAGPAVLFRQRTHPGMDMFFHATATALVREETGPWTLSVDYEEVTAPSVNILTDPAWTFTALAASAAYPRFATLSGEYTSMDDLATAATGGMP